ncbi:MAG: FecR domain-containing protein [Myxococcota bacterium]
MRREGLLALMLCFAAQGVGAAEGQATEEREAQEYEVQFGDTCIRIAQRFLGSRRLCSRILEANPSVPPSAIARPGTIIIIPGRMPTQETPSGGPDAEVTAAVRRVEAQAPAATEWRPAPRGQDLYRGWRVNTSERSAAELTFQDRSRIVMRENTLVIIFGSSSAEARRRTSQANLDRGSLRTAIGNLRMEVNTPAAVASLDGGSSVVSVDEAGTSRLSHHDGNAAVLASNSGGRTQVRPGFGTKAPRGRRPTRPRPLPAAPAWAAPPERFVGVEGAGATVRGEWSAVPDATRYRVFVRTEGDELVAAATVPANVTRFEVHGLPAGQYRARLSTIDNDFFESRLSPPHAFSVAVGRLELPSGENALGDYDVADPSEDPEAPSVLAGTRLRAPTGYRCRILQGGEELADGEEVTLQAGELEAHCASDDGPAMAFDLIAHTVTIAAAVEGNDRARMPRGAERWITLRTADTPLPPEVEVRASEGATVEEVVRDDRDVLRVRVTVARSAPDEVTLALRYGDAKLSETPITITNAAVADAEGLVDGQASLLRPRTMFDAFYQVPTPELLALYGNPRGSVVWGSVNGIGTLTNEASELRGMAGLQFGLVDNQLRFSLEGIFGNAQPNGGDHDLRVGLGWLIHDEGPLALFFEVGGYVPFGDDTADIAYSGQAYIQATDRILLRVRQGLTTDTRKEEFAWVSAYGIDILLDEIWGIAAEADLAIGESEGERVRGGAIGGGTFLHFGPLQIGVGFRGALGDALRSRTGRYQLTLGASYRFLE